MNQRTLSLLVACVLSLLIPQVPAHAQKSKMKAPIQTSAMKYSKAAEAWGEIIADRTALAEAIKTSKLSEAHDLVFSIRDNAVTLPYKSEGLPAAKRKLLDRSVQAVAALATSLDKYADAGNAARTKLEYARLVKALASIEAVYPPNTLPTSGARPMSAADRALFLTPGGLYTAADIKVNGNTSVYQKFPSFVASHDTKVKPGEPVCPISETKPDPKLTWVIGSKTYQFCCPPCVAEFVTKAKQSPASIKSPEAYIKK